MIQKVYQDRDWLRKHYIEKKESMPAIARGAGCGQTTIYRYLHKYEIPTRSRGEGVFLANRNFVIIAPDLLIFMGGEIIGDGSVRMASNRSARYTHGSKYREYLTWLSGYFSRWGIGQGGKITRHKDKQNGAISYNYVSKSYPELVPIYRRWYPEGKKIVPKDLKLTPIMVRQWYLGDGCLQHPKRERPFIEFHTQGLDKESVEYLVKKLGGLGFKAARHADNTIRLWVRSVQDFLKWIGPCPISCYDYKWDYSKGGTR